jgi:hypothetical protein
VTAAPEFLSVDDVLELHWLQIESFGVSRGIQGRGLMESAVVQPKASFGGSFLHEFPFEMDEPRLHRRQQARGARLGTDVPGGRSTGPTYG